MDFKVLRATEEWQRAGAYSVRIQGMNRQHHISLRDEFDEHDCDGTKYIVLLDDEYPIATCRFYEIDTNTATIGRVVVLPEYRGKKLGSKVICEAEKWIANAATKKLSSTVASKPSNFTASSAISKSTSSPSKAAFSNASA